MTDIPAVIWLQFIKYVIELPKSLEPWMQPQVSRIRRKLKELGQEDQHSPDLPKIKTAATKLAGEISTWDRSAKLRRPKCEHAFREAERKLDEIIMIIEKIEKEASNQDANRYKTLIALLVACGKINEAIDKPANMKEWRGQLRVARPPSRLHYAWFLVLPSVLYFSRSNLWQPKPSPNLPNPPIQCIATNDNDSKVQLIGEITDNDLHVDLNKVLNIDPNTRYTPLQYIALLSKKHKESQNPGIKSDIERYMPLVRILNNNSLISADTYYIAVAVPLDAENKPTLKALGILHGIDQAQRDSKKIPIIKVVIVNDNLESRSDSKLQRLAHAIATRGYLGKQFIGLIGHPSSLNGKMLSSCYEQFRLPVLSLSLPALSDSKTQYFQTLLPDAKRIAEKTSDFVDEIDQSLLVVHDNSTNSKRLGESVCIFYKKSDKGKCHQLNIGNENNDILEDLKPLDYRLLRPNWLLAFDPETNKHNEKAATSIIQYFFLSRKPQSSQRSSRLYLINDFFLEHRIKPIIQRNKRDQPQAQPLRIFRIGLWDWRAMGDNSQNNNSNTSYGDYAKERNWQFINSFNSFGYMHDKLRDVLNLPNISKSDAKTLRQYLRDAMVQSSHEKSPSSFPYIGGPPVKSIDDKKLVPAGESSKICKILLSDSEHQVDCK